MKVGRIISNHVPSKELFIHESGFEFCEPQKPCEYEKIDFYLLHYVEKGQGILKLNNTTYKINPGDIFFIPQYTANNYYPIKNNPWVYRWIGFNGTQAENLLNLCGFTKDTCIRQIGILPEIQELFYDIYRYCEKSNYLAALGSLYILLSQLSNIIKKDTIKQIKISSMETYFNEAIEYIHGNFYNNISIQDICNYINIDRTYLFKIFKKYVSTNPQNYILTYRIEKACHLLETTSYSIEEISELVGFSTRNYFCKQFKKIQAMAPSQYRNKASL